jgi:hypothetical protein
MRSLAIVVFCMAAAIVFGVLHDQITARVCVEYFTIGHLPIFGTNNPTLLGLGWGILATWWVGLLLGIPLALVARVGNRPKYSVKSLLRPVALLFAATLFSSLLGGLLGYMLATRGTLFLVGKLASEVPREKHPLFIADLWAHTTSYIVGFLGGIGIMAWVWRSRGAIRENQRG